MPSKNRSFVAAIASRSVNDRDLEFDQNGRVAVLLQDFDDSAALREPCLGIFVEIGTELREARELAVLRVEELELAGNLFHRLDLGAAADSRHGNTRVDGGADALVEELGLKEDLAVRN